MNGATPTSGAASEGISLLPRPLHDGRRQQQQQQQQLTSAEFKKFIIIIPRPPSREHFVAGPAKMEEEKRTERRFAFGHFSSRPKV